VSDDDGDDEDRANKFKRRLESGRSDTNDNPRHEPTLARNPHLAPGGNIGTTETPNFTQEATPGQIEAAEKELELKRRQELFDDLKEKVKDPDAGRSGSFIREDFDRDR